jgi:hypothetical protein
LTHAPDFRSGGNIPQVLDPRRNELHPDEYRTLAAFCRDLRVTVPEMVKVVALRLARTV